MYLVRKNSGNDHKISSTHIITEYVSGPSLLSFLDTNNKNRLHYIQTFSFQILKAISYLNEMKIVHGNIQTKNVLISDYQNEHKIKLKAIRNINSVNVKYRSPEHQIGCYSDIWSFGCVLLEMCTGE